MRVDPIGLADSDEIALLIRTAFAEQSVPTDPPASALRVSGDDVRSHLTKGGGVAVRIDGVLAGCALWGPRDGGLYVGRVSVAPGFRRRGIATALLEAAETAARRGGFPRLLLETRLVLGDNRALFAGLGFREVSLHAHPGYAHKTFVLMEKPLPEPQDGMGSPNDRA